jgi:D-alanyl-D-alanine carboxypeptidase/D-alanyl-D-alanine-endopeptidase (penicillin-binding protein 4)
VVVVTSASAAVAPSTTAIEPATATATGTPGAAAGLLATPLLSPARIPITLQSLTAGQSLGPALASAMSAKAIGAGAAAASCAEVAQDGVVLYQDHPDRPVLPASNMKLITSTALLDKLGPNYTFTTTLRALHPPANGVLEGNIYFVGGGDPLLREPSYAASASAAGQASSATGSVFTNVTKLVGDLQALGIHEVTGGVVGDGSRYNSLTSVPGWPARYVEEGDVGALSALGIDDGFATAGPPVPVGAPPAVQSAGVLTDLLRSAGIDVEGAPSEGQPPAGTALIAQLASAPLSQILGEVLRESDNTAMELLTKELGLKEYGSGSTAAGLRAVWADLAGDGLPVEGFVNADGSGLSRSDRVTCALLVAVLLKAGANGLLVRDLPVAGRSGTLAEEMQRTIAAGRVRAKTGTLDDVKALSGWVWPAPGQGAGNPQLSSPVVFASVLNDLATTLPETTGSPADLTSRVALDIAAYPKVPALARFEP